MSHKLICGDVLDVLPTLGRFKCLIADPPDNIGLEYGEYDDNLADTDYCHMFTDWLRLFMEHADIVWVSFNAKWVFAVSRMLQWQHIGDVIRDYEARLFVQTFTFGQNRQTDCGNGYRPILRLMHKDAALYPDYIRVPSWRQQHGDKRADPRGRVPLDVWEFPRVVGNSRQRRRHHPTQLHEGIVERMILLSTLPGDTICDCFSGTGTVLRAVMNLSDKGGRCALAPRNNVTSIELDDNYCARIAAEHGLRVEYLTGAAA